jgi:type IV secretory pathway VirB10-like protein
LLLVLGAAAAVVVLFVLLRPGDEDDEAAPAASTTTVAETETDTEGETETDTETDTVTETETQPTTTAPPPPDVVNVRLTIQDGRPVGGVARPSVRQGRRVRLVVRSDVADHVHLHGYDIMRDVAPGSPAQIVFTAELPGRFEIELEDRGVQLAELEVRP